MASSAPMSEFKEISLILLGKIGQGKSSTGNTILGWPAFKKSDSPYANTATAILNCSEREDGTRIRVIDTPGVMDTEKRNDFILPKICDAMSLCPNGFNALIFVVKYGIRYTKEERKCLEVLKEYFGSRFLKDYGIVVMTQGDSFDLNHEEDKMPFKDWLKVPKKKEQDESFDRLLEECNNRCVLFYNSGKKFESKRKRNVDELLTMITKMPNPYCYEHIELAQIMRETIIKNLNIPMLHTSIQEKLSLLIENIHKDLRNNTFSNEDMMKNLKELEKEVDNVRGEFKDPKEFESLKKNLQSVKRKLQRIFSLEEREKQNAEQEQLLKDLEILKERPDRMPVYLAKAFKMSVTLLKPITWFSCFPERRRNVRMLETISKNILKEMVAEYDKRVEIFNEAKMHVEESSNVT